MVIDIHAHYPKRTPDFPEHLVELMPQAGIDRVVLFSAGEALGHEPNEVILAAAKKHPDKIIPFAYVELGTDTVECVARHAAEGFRGFKITNPRSSYDDEAYFPIYEAMEKTGMPLLAHTGILMRFPTPAGVRVNSNWMRPICLDPVLRSFPGLNIIGAHLGAPWYEEAGMMARLHPNYYVDLTGAYWGGWRVPKKPEFFHEIFFLGGAWKKVLFGTDILSLEELVPSKLYHDKMMAAIGLPEETMTEIYGGTAARLLGLVL